MSELEELRAELAASLKFDVPDEAQVLDTGDEFIAVFWSNR